MRQRYIDLWMTSIAGNDFALGAYLGGFGACRVQDGKKVEARRYGGPGAPVRVTPTNVHPPSKAGGVGATLSLSAICLHVEFSSCRRSQGCRGYGSRQCRALAFFTSSRAALVSFSSGLGTDSPTETKRGFFAISYLAAAGVGGGPTIKMSPASCGGTQGQGCVCKTVCRGVTPHDPPPMCTTTTVATA